MTNEYEYAPAATEISSSQIDNDVAFIIYPLITLLKLVKEYNSVY